MIYTGLALRSSSLRVKNFGIRTKAKIIDYEVKRLGVKNNSKSYYPIVEFTTVNNETIFRKLKLSERRKKLNSIVDIYYLKENSKYEVIKDSKWWTTYWPYFYITFGIILLTGGIIYVLKTN